MEFGVTLADVVRVAAYAFFGTCAALIVFAVSIEVTINLLKKITGRDDQPSMWSQAAIGVVGVILVFAAGFVGMRVIQSSDGNDLNPYPRSWAGIPDRDCADLRGAVAVLESDPHFLDRDSDGVGCEWGPDGKPNTGDE